MPRVVPSQVVAFINELTFPEVAKGITRVNSIGSARLLGVLDLVEQVPDELLVMDGATYASFVVAKADIKDLLEIWNADRTAGNKLREVLWNTSRNPLTIIQKTLAKCPDESPAPATSELKFITDADLRTNLRNDIGAINRALSNGEWKAATVLAGSAIEALLLWDLQNRHAASVPAAIRALVANNTALETFQTLGIEFVSFSEQLDTSTATGKMVFTVLGAVAELERSLIVERVRAGMRNARAKGKRIGRPPRTYISQDARRSIYEAHATGGASLRQLAVTFGTSIGTVQRCIQLYQKAST